MDGYALHEGASAAFSLVDAANEYIAETEPWTLAKQGQQDRLTQVLSDVVEAVRIAAVLLLPVMPGSCAEILRRMGETRPVSDLRLDADTAWTSARERVVAKADPLWPRLEANKEPSMSEQPAGQPPAPSNCGCARRSRAGSARRAGARPGTQSLPRRRPRRRRRSRRAGERIPIDDFVKIDLRVAKILAAEKVKGSRKLIKMQVDVGTEQRTLVAGIAEAYEPEALVGRSVVIVANLKPAKLMGIESNGMVLAASPEGGLPALLGFENPPPPGSRVK